MVAKVGRRGCACVFQALSVTLGRGWRGARLLRVLRRGWRDPVSTLGPIDWVDSCRPESLGSSVDNQQRRTACVTMAWWLLRILSYEAERAKWSLCLAPERRNHPLPTVSQVDTLVWSSTMEVAVQAVKAVEEIHPY